MGGAFAQILDHGLYKAALHHNRGHANSGKEPAYFTRPPTIAIACIEHEDRRQHGMGQLREEDRRTEAPKLAVAEKKFQAAQRIGLAPIEGARFSRFRDSGNTKKP